VYYLDKNGYLLDENKCYILDDQNKMIQIDDHALPKIKEKCEVVLESEYEAEIGKF
jgi:hypothetical protein